MGFLDACDGFPDPALLECLSSLPRAIQGVFCPYPECPSWHPGYAVACSQTPLRCGRYATAYGLFPPTDAGRRRANNAPASMLARRLPIRRLMVGRYAPTAVCSGSFLPLKFCGGQKWPVGFERMRLRRVGCLSPSAPGGGTGRKGKGGIAGFRGCSRWSLEGPLSWLATRWHRS
jgi:hypothetical protein